MLIYISICLQSCIRYYIVNDPYKYDHYRPSENELYGLWQSIEDSASIRLNKDGTCEVKNIPTTRRSEEFSTTKYSTLPYIVYGEANKLSSITETEFPITQTTSFLGVLTKLLETKEKINEKIEEYNKIFIRYRDKLTEDFINEKVLILQKELNDNNFILTRGMYNEHIEELNQINEHILELKKLIKTTKSQIDIQQDEFLNKYFAEIQNIFSRLGGEHYRIERSNS